jgi:hypothetical protein
MFLFGFLAIETGDYKQILFDFLYPNISFTSHFLGLTVGFLMGNLILFFPISAGLKNDS